MIAWGKKLMANDTKRHHINPILGRLFHYFDRKL